MYENSESLHTLDGAWAAVLDIGLDHTVVLVGLLHREAQELSGGWSAMKL